MTAHSERIGALQQCLRRRGLTAALLHMSRDIFYYTGTAQPGWLFVAPDDAHLYVRSGLGFARRQSSLPDNRVSLKSRLADIVDTCLGEDTDDLQIGAELDVMTVPQYQQLGKVLGSARIVDVSSDILEQRKIKDAGEIETIEIAAQALEEGHRQAIKAWRVGMTELEASAIVEDGHRRAGHEGVFFVRQPDFTMGRGPLASGENRQQMSGVVFTVSGCGLSAAVPAGASRRKLQPGDLVIVDIPTCVQGYHGDQSRTYCIGQPTKKALDLHQSLRLVSDRLIADISPAMTSGEVFDRACHHAEDARILGSFLKFSDGKMAHFVGHGVGLDLNEPPFLSRGGEEKIMAGMVLAIELHLCDAEVGMLKLEDMIVVHDDGCHILTKTDRELIPVPLNVDCHF
ncbi:Xaa-Pro dipeptidase [Roseovarius sp. MBR-154]